MSYEKVVEIIGEEPELIGEEEVKVVPEPIRYPGYERWYFRRTYQYGDVYLIFMQRKKEPIGIERLEEKYRK